MIRILVELLSVLTGDPTQHFEDRFGKARYCQKATIFGTHGDKWAGGDALYLGRPIRPEKDLGIAHRTLPVGSKVILQNAEHPEKWVVVTVVDRGPYGAVLREGEKPLASQRCMARRDGRVWCVKKKKEQPGKWRGCVDTTPLAAKLIGHKGIQKVKYWPIPGTKPDSVWDWPAYKGKKNAKRKRSRAR